MRESAFYLIHLMSCALNDVQPCSLPEGASWDEVYALAEFNSVEGLAWTSARRVRDVPADMLKEWSATADMTLYRCVSYGIEREAVLAALADRGLSWLPLKGALLVDLYPSPHMRSMADNDILYGFVEEDPAGGFRIAGATEADRERTTARAVRVAVEVMEARGYRTISKTAIMSRSLRTLTSISNFTAGWYRLPVRRLRTTITPGSVPCPSAWIRMPPKARRPMPAGAEGDGSIASRTMTSTCTWFRMLSSIMTHRVAVSGFWSISWCFYVHAARVSIDPILQTSFPSWVFEILSSGRAGCRFARWRIRERLAVARKGGTLKEARRKRQRVFRMPTRRVFCA